MAPLLKGGLKTTCVSHLQLLVQKSDFWAYPAPMKSLSEDAPQKPEF